MACPLLSIMAERKAHNMKRLITLIVFLMIPFIFMGCGPIWKKDKGGGDLIDLTLADAPTNTDILVQYYVEKPTPSGRATYLAPVLKTVTTAEFDINRSDPTLAQKDYYRFIGRVPSRSGPISNIGSSSSLSSVSSSLASYELYLQPFNMNYRIVMVPFGRSAGSLLQKTEARVFDISSGFLHYQQDPNNPDLRKVVSNGLAPLCEFYSPGYVVTHWDFCVSALHIPLRSGKRFIGLIHGTTPEDRTLGRNQ